MAKTPLKIDYGPKFDEKIQSFSPDEMVALGAVVQPLVEWPLPGESLLDVRPYTEGDLKNSFTVPIREMKKLIHFQVLESIGMLRLVDLVDDHRDA